jgi:hypothetical protein
MVADDLKILVIIVLNVVDVSGEYDVSVLKIG